MIRCELSGTIKSISELISIIPDAPWTWAAYQPWIPRLWFENGDMILNHQLTMIRNREVSVFRSTYSGVN